MNAKDPNDPNHQVSTKGTLPCFVFYWTLVPFFLHLVAQQEKRRVNWRYTYS